MKRLLLAFIVLTFATAAPINAQISITSSTNGAQLSNLLVGSGVTISNPVLNCAQGTFNGSGTFTGGTGSNLPINQGVVLMTGDVTQVGTAASNLSSVLGNNLGDAQLDALSPGNYPSHDRCILEFDVIPLGDTLRFKYSFASEEYPEYVCSSFADVFGFFVTGPKPGGGNYTNQNIALVPGTTLPVSINTVNSGTPGGLYPASGCQSLAYSSLYIDNQTSTTLIFDAFTTSLLAKIAVIPCQTYHLKLAIADVSDQAFDSGVFLEAGSISSTNVTVKPQTAYGNNFQNAVEGCVDGQFRFVINPPLTTNYTINYIIAGTATNGVDYTTIPNSITIPAGDTVGLLNITALSDLLNEGTETIKLYLLNPCNNLPYDSATLLIQDSIYADATADRYFICAGESAVLIGQGGLGYQWAPASGLSSTTAQTTIATPTVTTTYSMTASIGACIGRDTLTIHVSNPNFTVDAGPNQTICANQSVQLQPVITQGAAPYTYQWSPTTYMNPGGSTQQNPIVTPLQTTTYTLSVSSTNGCTLKDSVTITVSGAGPPVTATVNPTTICAGQQVQLDFTSSPTSCSVNYVGCGGADRIDSVGAPFFTQTGSPTTNVTIYGNYYKSTRMQLIYTAAEINAIFGGGGTIKSLAWQVGTFNSNATLENFTISIKCVSPAKTTLSTWETGMKRVYGPKLYTPVAGWNNHNLDSLYDWDGVSNLVIEICFYNPNTFSNFNNMMVYSTVPNSVIYSRANTDQCGINGTITSSNQRPKLRMRLCQPVYSNFVIAWTPSTGPNAVSNPAIKNPTANPQTTQQYQVTVSQGGCSGSGFVTVNVDTTVKVNAGPDKSFCTGQQVQLTAIPSGSPLPGQNFTYQWKIIPSGTVVGISQNVNVNPNTPTTYVVTMTGGPCPVYDTINVYIGALGVTHTITNITCNGANNGKIKLTPTGTAPYTFQWSANAATGNVDSAVNLAPGTYYVTVTDGQNCVGRDTIILTQPAVVSFTSSVSNVSCNGGNDGLIAISPSGGTGTFNFVWSNGAPNNDTAFNLPSGSYQVTVNDANNCSASGTFNVTQPTALTFNPAQTKNIKCFNDNDGFIIVSPTGGTAPYTYTWSHNAGLNQPNATTLTAGNYDVTVVDTKGCTITQNFTLTQPATGLAVSTPTVTDATCFGYSNGQATINAVGGSAPYSYQWAANANNQTTQTATNLGSGTYSYTVTDDSLCTAIGSATINQPAQIQITGTVTNVFCFGNSDANIDITVTNGVTPLIYQWSNGPATEDVINIPAGQYSVTVTDNTSCSQSASFTVTQPPLLVLNAPTITNVSCFGGSNGAITANPAGGTGTYTYTWNPSGNTQTINGLTAGTYNITLSDANSCSVTDSYQVTQPAAPLLFGTPVVIDVLCNGAATGSITVSVTGGTTPYSYSWSHNNQLNSNVASSLIAGTYTVTVTDANSCSLTSSSTITQPPAITFGNPIVTNVSCFGYSDGSAEVTPSGGTGGFTYTWNGVAGTNPQGGLSAATYTVIVTDANSCNASTTLTINQPSALVLNPIVQDALCYGANNGSVDANPSGGNTPYTFVWNDSQNQTTQTAVNLYAGNYSVTLTDNTGCTVSAPALVNEPTELLFTMQTTQVSCPGDADGTITVNATGATPPYNYSATQDGANFFFANNNGVIQNLASGLYAVIVSDNNGCTKVDTAFVPAPVNDTFTLTTDSTSCYGPAYNDGAVHVTGLTVANMPYQYSLDGSPKQYSGDFYFVSAGPHQVVATNSFGCTTTLSAIVPEPADAFADVLPGDTTIDLGQTIQLFSTFGPYPLSSIVSYSWTPSTGLSCIDCPNPLVNPYSRMTEYTLTITYNDHCVASASMTVLVENNLEVFIPNSFSPNGDGNNDVFTIYGQGIKTIDLKIFNRWGEKVYESNSQFAGWDGTYQGVLQNPGVYVYEVKITFLDNRKKEKTGSITILR
jgi:gliding motility-associated-like protein